MNRKGISTKRNASIRVDEDRGIWYESDGIGVGEILSLFKVLDFGSFGERHKASGYDAESYESDSSKLIILPLSETERSIEWLNSEYERGNYARKKQLMNLTNATVKEIDRRILSNKIGSRKMDLYKSRRMYKDFIDYRS